MYLELLLLAFGRFVKPFFKLDGAAEADRVYKDL